MKVERVRAAREDRATCWGSRPERPAACPAVIGCAALCAPGLRSGAAAFTLSTMPNVAIRRQSP